MLNQRGDTIVEVLLAIVVFSLVSVGAMTVMNQGTNSAQRALEVTLVKQQIDGQAEALRAAQQDYFSGGNKAGSAWRAIQGQPNLTNPIEVGGSCPEDLRSEVFAMNARTAELVDNSRLVPTEGEEAPPYAKVVYDDGGVEQVYGLWIEKREKSGFAVKAYDFTIRACWYGPGLDVPMQLQTTVRLYDE